MKKTIKKTILNIKPYVPGKPIEEVKRELGISDVIKLASNENPYGPSPKVVKAITRAARNINRYPDGDCFYLRQQLAKQLSVNRRQLIFGNGSDELIVLAVRACVQPGDEVVMAWPCFLVYHIASRIEGAKIKAVPLKNFRYDLKGMKKAITKKTKIVFLGNPDNPSGSYLTQEEVNQFLKGLRKDILVLMDEAYYEYVRAKDYVKSLTLIKRHKNIFVTRTFSKMYGLAGLRIGYGIADESLISILNRIREPFNVNSIAQEAALACLKDKSYYRKKANELEQQRRFLYRSFKEMNIGFVESCTNFILVKVNNDADIVTRQLLRKGLIVRNMNFWGMKHFIRINIGTPKENKKLLNTLKEIL